MPAQESDETTITIISHADLGQVQGATETYYVTRELGHEYDVHLFAYSDPGFDGVTYHQPDSGPGPALGLNFIQLPTIIKHLRRTDTDVLYTYKGFHIGAWLAARVAGCKWIIDFRSSPTGQKREFSTINGTISKIKSVYWDITDYCYKVALPRADRVVTLSGGIASELVEEYNVESNQLIHLPLGVDSSKFDPASFDVVRGDKPYDCVYLGAIASLRGIDTLLDGISHLDSPEDDIAVHIIGDGPQDDISWLQAKADDLGITDIVAWHGYVDHEEIPELLAGMDIALSPLPDHESYRVSSPAKMYEYLSMGLPIVASDIEAHQTVLAEGETGFLFPSEDVSGLADALRDAITAIEERGPAVRKSVRAEGTRYDWKQRIKPVIDFIESETPE